MYAAVSKNDDRLTGSRSHQLSGGNSTSVDSQRRRPETFTRGETVSFSDCNPASYDCASRPKASQSTSVVTATPSPASSHDRPVPLPASASSNPANHAGGSNPIHHAAALASSTPLSWNTIRGRIWPLITSTIVISTCAVVISPSSRSRPNQRRQSWYSSTTLPVQNKASKTVDTACTGGKRQSPCAENAPATRATRFIAPASQSDTSTSTRIFAHSSMRGPTGRCIRISASSLLNKISPAEAATNMPRKAKVIPCR